MRKKELLKINDELFKRLDSVTASFEELKKDYEALQKELLALKEENSRLTALTEPSAPSKALEQKGVDNACRVSEDTEYASSVIGKIVVSAAKHCNKLTAWSDSPEIRELVNLILGRTEVAKANILKILSSQTDNHEKRRNIDKELEVCEDYFLSIMAQYN
ncbi:MAG: hypothetical protein IKD04_03690 [Clostridia bacterium]|nr:hypothetical protein [Clostridia bacterium]